MREARGARSIAILRRVGASVRVLGPEREGRINSRDPMCFELPYSCAYTRKRERGRTRTRIASSVPLSALNAGI